MRGVLSNEALAIIKQETQEKRSSRQIMVILRQAGFSYTQKTVLRAMTIYRELLPSQAVKKSLDQHERNRRSDRLFQERMLLAINQGRERPHVGILIDDSPFSCRVQFFNQTLRSGCGSSSAMCEEIGDK